MRPGELLRRLPDEVRPRLQPSVARFHSSTAFSLTKIWYGNRDIHFEVWIRSRLDVIEIGLHFESDPLTNARLLAAFRSRARAIQRDLGGSVRIEEWDKGWARVWEPIALDAGSLEALATRLAAYIDALEPIVVEELPAGVRWAEPPARQRATARTAAKRSR